MFSNHFDVLMSKIILKKIKKNIILMCFEMKNTLKTQPQSHSQTHSSLSKSLICVLKGEITGFFC